MKKITIVILYFLYTIASYGQDIPVTVLKNGDLIFVAAKKENLSGAINRVTQQSEKISFDHVALVEVQYDSIFVIHATGKKGSIRQSFSEFVQQQEESNTKLAIYRLGADYQKAIPQAIEQAKSLLGQPYNWSYVLNDSSLYCSDYVERVFRTFDIFTLEPMTFINPKTGSIDSFWVDFYKKQGMEVPEGKLGCNPNGLAASSKLVFVGNLASRNKD